MYRINDTQEAVREIKKYLYAISKSVYPQIGRTTVDGQYDEKTKESVIRFQKIKGLAADGVVDLETFAALYEVYSDVQEAVSTRDYIVERTDFPIGVGSSGENVRALHILINELGKEHPSVEDVGAGSFYSARTARAVRSLRQVYGLPQSDEVDRLTFSMMRAELDAIRRRDKNPERNDLFAGRRL